MRQEKSDFVALNEENYVDLAEQVIESLERDRRGNIKLSTSQIRNILAMSSDIYSDVMEIKGDKLIPEIIGRINYLKVRIVYEEGRNPDVKDFAEKAKLRFYIGKQGEVSVFQSIYGGTGSISSLQWWKRLSD